MIFKEFVKEIRDLNSSTLLNKTVVCIAKDTFSGTYLCKIGL